MEAYALDFEKDYEQWRSFKLENWPTDVSDLKFTVVNDPLTLLSAEIEDLRSQCAQTNFALYRLQDPLLGTKKAIRGLVRQLGMLQLDQNLCADNDSISTLKVMELNRASGYIPYTENALNWHTDGYYNELGRHIRSFFIALHTMCESRGRKYVYRS